MLIWRRAGLLVPAIYLCIVMLTALVTEWIFGSEMLDNGGDSAMLITGNVIAGLLIGIIGYYLNHVKRPSYVDEFGQEFREPTHDFFYIPMEYWAILAPALVYFKSDIISIFNKIL